MKLDKASILAALATLDRTDQGRKLFGAIGHQYRLNPPLSLSVVEAFEKRHGIQLPEDYKYFITSIGNGGAGPHYGVFPFGEEDDHCKWEGGCLVGDLGKPFPHRERWNLTDEFWAREPKPPPGTPLEEEDRMMEAWDKELEEHYWNPAIMNGAIPICDRGCALRQWLVVNGPQRGCVWNDDRADYGGIDPLLDSSGKPMTFSDWYLSWLHGETAGSVASGTGGGRGRASSHYFSEWTFLGAMILGLVPGMMIGGLLGVPFPLAGLVGALATLTLIAGIDWLVVRAQKRHATE